MQANNTSNVILHVILYAVSACGALLIYCICYHYGYSTCDLSESIIFSLGVLLSIKGILDYSYNLPMRVAYSRAGTGQGEEFNRFLLLLLAIGLLIASIFLITQICA